MKIDNSIFLVCAILFIIVFFSNCNDYVTYKCCVFSNYEVSAPIDNFICHIENKDIGLGSLQPEVLSLYRGFQVRDITYPPSQIDTTICPADRYFSIKSDRISKGYDIRVFESLNFCSGYLKEYIGRHKLKGTMSFEEAKSIFKYNDNCIWNDILDALQVTANKSTINKENYRASFVLHKIKTSGRDTGWELQIVYELQKQ